MGEFIAWLSSFRLKRNPVGVLPLKAITLTLAKRRVISLYEKFIDQFI